MHLEYGQWPAHFELKKMRCTFLKQILKQGKNSQIYRFFKLQLKNPVKGDWVSTCLTDLIELEIKETLEEIKSMLAYKFKNLVKSKIEIKALEYRLTKRGSKGQEIEYTRLEMSEYLLPFNSKLNIEETRTTKVVLEAQGNMFSAVCALSIYSLEVVFIFEVVFILRSSSF